MEERAGQQGGGGRWPTACGHKAALIICLNALAELNSISSAAGGWEVLAKEEGWVEVEGAWGWVGGAAAWGRPSGCGCGGTAGGLES